MITVQNPDHTLQKLILPQKPKAGVTYIPSQFSLPFEHNGKQYVYHTLTRQCIEGELPDSAQAGEQSDPLIESMFLVPEQKDECAFYSAVSAMMHTFSAKKGVRSYTILPTLGCNARCVYCYEEGRKPVTMDRETAEQTVRYILDNRGSDKIRLIWFGGEPLLCVDTIEYICARLKEADVAYRSIMVSNGSLITPEILDQMLHSWNLDYIQISMDGAEQDYVSRKRYPRDKDQYHTVMHAVDRMSEAGITVAIRCNVDEQNLDDAQQFLDDLDRNVAHKAHVCVYFSPLYDVRAGERDLELWERIVRIRPLIEQHGFKPLPYLVPRPRFRVFYCMADSGGTVVGPNGSLYPCEHCPPESRFGDVFHGVTDAAAKQAFCRTDNVREMCRSCTFLPDCTGFAACPWKDTHCRDLRKMMALDTLKRMIDNKNDPADDEEDPFC